MSADFETTNDLGSFQPQMFVNIDGKEKVLFDPGRVIVARDTVGHAYWHECGLTQEFADEINSIGDEPLMKRWDDIEISNIRSSVNQSKIHKLADILINFATGSFKTVKQLTQ